jgi:hypothetical protein
VAVLHSVRDQVQPNDRHDALLYRDVLLYADAFWREEVAGLREFYKPALDSDPPPEIELAGGFSVLG